MLVLALSTSSARGSVALILHGNLLGQRHYDDNRRHAERIFGEVDALLNQCSMTRKKLGAIACDVGPGSFTGTRVGLASAKGMALGLGLPLWPANALQAMALAALSGDGSAPPPPAEPRTVMPCLAAQRGEVFYAVYNHTLKTQVPPTQVPRAGFAQIANTQQAAGAVLCGAVLDELPPGANGPYRRVMSAGCAGPDAHWLGKLAWRQYHHQAATTPPPRLARIEPIYVRAPDAVPNLPKPLVLQS